MKLCKDCRYFVWLNPVLQKTIKAYPPVCSHPKNTGLSRVFGCNIIIHTCEEQRMPRQTPPVGFECDLDKWCGPYARWFEEKEEK